ncbi:MAG: hypothetical protein AB7F59_09610 [Bdellovibrionales bacterium]
MEKTVNLTLRKLPEMLGELRHSNQFLKLFSLLSLILVTLVFALLFVMATRPAVLLTLDTSASVLEQREAPKAEDQIRAAVKAYIDLRYKWEPKNVQEKLKNAQAFVLSSSLSAFQAAVTNVAKFSTEKLVSQRVYPEVMEVNLKNKTVFVKGDRVTDIQGLKAAGNLRLELSFESGPRTKDNPWGLYITKEKEE